jgi:O-antigen ligase
MGIFARRRRVVQQPAEREFAISKGQVFGLLLVIGFLGYLVTSSSIQLSSGLIASVGGIGFLVLFFASIRRPELPLYGLVAYLPFSKILPGDFGGAAGGLNMTNLFMAVIAMGWFSAASSERRKVFEGHALHVPVLLFAMWGIVSFVQAISLLGGWVFTARIADLKRWLDPIMIYIMFFNVVHDKRRWKTIVVVLLIGVFMAAASAALEYQTDSGGGSLESSRIGGIAGQPNILGAFFVYYMFIYAAFWLENLGKAKAWLNLIPFLVCFRAIMVTFSRGAYLAFAQGVLGLAFFKNKVLFALAVGGIAFMLLNPFLLPPGIRYRLESTFRSNTQLVDPYSTDAVEGALDKSSAMRLLIWKAAGEIVQRHPWVGVGFGEFKNAIGFYSDEVKQIDAHNAYIIMAAELGIPALCFFILILGMLMWVTAQVYTHHPDPFIKATALGFLGGLSGLLMANMFGSRLNSVEVAGYFWILAGLMARAHAWVVAERKAKRAQAPSRGQRAGVVINPGIRRAR